MATARSVIKTALRLISAIQPNETPTADEAQDGLEALNDLLSSWALHGVEVDHSSLVLDDDVNLPDSHMQGIKYILAVKLAPEYGVAITPEVASVADHEWQKIQAHHTTVEEMSLDTALAWNPSKRNWWYN